MPTVRDATQADCPSISRVLCACYHWFGDNDVLSPEIAAELVTQCGSVEYVRKLMSSVVTFVAEQDRLVVGTATVKENELNTLYVDPTCHRKGIGRMLFDEAAQAIAAGGFDEMFLGTGASTSIRFYEAMGMRRSGDKIVESGPCKGWTIAVYSKPLKRAT